MLEVIAISPSGVPRGRIKVLSAQAVVRKNDVDTWVVEADLTNPVASAVADGWSLTLDDGYTRLSGPVTAITTEVEAAQRTLVISGVGELQHLKDRLVYPNPTLPITRQDVAYYKAKAPAGEVLHTLVDYAVGQRALATRRVAGFRVSVPPGGTTTIPVSERFSNVLEVAQGIAHTAGLVFSAVRTDGGEILFTSRPARDLARAYRFEATGSFSYQAPKATAVVIAQQGEGADRFIQEKVTTSSWSRRVEVLKDRRDTDDPTVGETEATKILEENSQTSSATLTIPANHRAVFGVDFSIGDIVNVQLGDVSIQEPVTQADITWDGYGRTVEITVGSTTPGQSTEARITTQYKELAQRLQKLESR